MSLMMFMMIFVMLSISIASVERINEVLTTKATIVSPENGLKEVADGSINFDDVDFAHTRMKMVTRPMSSKISLWILILGKLLDPWRNRIRKSSLVQLIPRLYDVEESGQVTVAGHDVKDYDLDSFVSRVAMVLQTNVLFSGTIKENMRWGNKDATDEEIIAACKDCPSR